MEKHGRPSLWLSTLGLITFIHTLAFLVVTILQLTDLNRLQKCDIKLQESIVRLKEKYGDYGNAVSHIHEKDNIPAKDKMKKRSSSNFISDLLQSQEQVIAQHCVNHHKMCSNGSKGESGEPGDQGPKGQKGERGSVGLRGDVGPKGTKGEKGEPGNNGTRGVPGEPGSVGPTGQKGERGINGIRGPKGEQGEKGGKGSIGPQGISGETGQQGAKGDPGYQGVKGVRGNTGIKGEKGAIGLVGPPGHNRKQIQDGCACLKNATIRQFPSDQTVTAGQQKELRCLVTGNPTPKVTWFRDGTQIKTDSTHNISNDSLILTNSSKSDSGSYLCRAENSVSVTSSPPWKIIVL